LQSGHVLVRNGLVVVQQLRPRLVHAQLRRNWLLERAGRRLRERLWLDRLQLVLAWILLVGCRLDQLQLVRGRLQPEQQRRDGLQLLRVGHLRGLLGPEQLRHVRRRHAVARRPHGLHHVLWRLLLD
jgi:hypothetical protein